MYLHAFFTPGDPRHRRPYKTHRTRAIIEQVHAADLQGSELAHLPEEVFTANAAWLVVAVMAFNLTRGRRHLERTRARQGHPDGLTLGSRLEALFNRGISPAARAPQPRPVDGRRPLTPRYAI